MNLQTTEIHTKGSKKRVRNYSRKSKNSSFAIVFRIIAILILIFLITSARAVLNGETEELKRSTISFKSDLKVADREIANLKMKQAHYRGRYIIKQIRKFDLKLQNPRIGQVKRVEFVICSSKNVNNIEIGKLLFSQR